MKIREMEDCLKSMNEENDSLKGKLGNVISHIGTPNDPQKSDSKINNNSGISSNDNLRTKVKKKNFSSIVNNNTSEDLRGTKFKSNSNISSSAINDTYVNSNHRQQLLSHYKTNSVINNNNINENENRENNLSDESNDSHEDERTEYLSNNNNNDNFNNFNSNINNMDYNRNLNCLNSVNKNEYINNNSSAVGAGKKSKDSNSNMLKWTRHLTLGKGSYNNLNSFDVSSNFINEENHFGNLHGSNSNINDGNNRINNLYKVNPFVDNTSTFMNNDYENINDKISNLDQIENMDNTNNLEEIEQMDNEDEDSENYGNEFPPLQLRIKNKKKGNKL